MRRPGPSSSPQTDLLLFLAKEYVNLPGSRGGQSQGKPMFYPGWPVVPKSRAGLWGHPWPQERGTAAHPLFFTFLLPLSCRPPCQQHPATARFPDPGKTSADRTAESDVFAHSLYKSATHICTTTGNSVQVSEHREGNSTIGLKDTLSEQRKSKQAKGRESSQNVPIT